MVGLLEVLDLVGRLDVLTMVAAALRMLGVLFTVVAFIQFGAVS